MRGVQHIEELKRDAKRSPYRHASPRACTQCFDRVAFEQFHDKERRSVFGHVIVEYRDHALVIDGIGYVALTQKARAKITSHRILGVQ